MKLVVKYPSRGRAARFFEFLEEYLRYTEDWSTTNFLVSLDEDDPSLDRYLEGFKRIPESFPITIQIGSSQNKIHALNRDLDLLPEWDILMVVADDMVPILDRYDSLVKHLMKSNYPDLDGVLFFNDGYQREGLNTLPILGRKYFERFNYVYNPEYKSFFADNEFMEVAYLLGKQTYFDTTIIRHDHPINSGLYWDDLYLSNQKYWDEDYSLYLKRKALNFDI